MNIIDFYLSQLDGEAKRSRRMLENMPDNQRGFKPHERSMELGPLADMVAMIPMWFAMIIKQDELDLAPKDGKGLQLPKPNTRAEYLGVLDKAVSDARDAFKGTNEAHLKTHWKLLVAGLVVADTPREEMLRDTFSHWVHHRGQMTVYLRLMGALVPALYGPSADEQRFD
jgi:uncharacterized damage-inducible protein DinB